MARLEDHLFVGLDNTVGKLAEVTGSLREAGININSLITFGEGEQGTMVLATSDNARAREVMAGSVRVINEMPVLLVMLPNRAGAFHEIASKIGEAGLAIEWAVATTAGDEAAVILTTSDNRRAADIL